ncbi:MAG: FAD-dependent oxidoreductase [Candidatus Portnoybacteria bacterium]|nr:FAD-dependent oxidoreductase [Candidatus Portnoybacteria bacterium]
MYDLIIIGGGPAAVSAGIYAARKKMKTLLIAKSWGGQAALAPLVENYAGVEPISGAKLVERMVGQLKKNEIEIKEGLGVKNVLLVDKGLTVEVETEDGSEQGRALIVATGRTPKRLGLPNEEKFIGKGIVFCATCDAPMFKDKEVAVIGGGNSAANTALEAAVYASKVYLLARSVLRADEVLQERLEKSDKIEIMTGATVQEIKGDKFVSGLVYKKDASEEMKEMSVEGIFVAIGSIPNSTFIKNVVELNKWGEIKINSRNATSRPNIFAAGDVSGVLYKQMIIAAGEGAKAALSAYKYISNK